MEEKYIGHVNSETKEIQSLKEHLENVRYLAEKNCPLELFRYIAQVTALIHDMGKTRQEFQDYMNDILEHGEYAIRHQIDHSSAGGLLVEDMSKFRSISSLIGTAIYAHHGLQDCIDMESGAGLAEKRRVKETDYEEIKNRYFQIVDKKELHDLLVQANRDWQKIYQHVKEVVGDTQSSCGDKEFYLGMYERFLLSILIDGDWSDTASMMNGEMLPERMSAEETLRIWECMLTHYRNYMDDMKQHGTYSPLNCYREEISDRCYEASQERKGRYRLTVPTGAGKTLSSLRFALNRAVKEKKQHIFYISPYNSVLEQNADEIRKAVGNESYILEHHCNIVNEDAVQEVIYKNLTDNWDCPLIATTAVQLLNTLFSGDKSCIRRMYSLCNSIIVFDEVQAIPAKCTELFNLAVNFLTEFCNTTVVLCSATQPSLASLPQNNLMECREMADRSETYAEAFRRVGIEDKTDLVPGGMLLDDLKDFTREAFRNYKQVLVIVNTKKLALELYESLKQEDLEACALFHLSTNMCPANREDMLTEIKGVLHDRKKPVICVSTQLVEAGIDFSFGCVIRSLAGLDSIVQAAGRCNRHKERKMGIVYIVKMAADLERIGRMKEMTAAQDACKSFLLQFHNQPDDFQNTPDSETAVKQYYRLYYQKLGSQITQYPCSQTETSLVELLGKNEAGVRQYARHHDGQQPAFLLRQAFQTAGKEFEVISEDGKVSVVAPYNEEARALIAELETGKKGLAEQKQILRKLQRYTVSISPTMKEKLRNALYQVGDTGVLVLNDMYYNQETGVQENPIQGFLDF